jgi:uncharacterized membrane protein YeiH
MVAASAAISGMEDHAERIVRAADLTGSFVFAVEGALAAIDAGFDPIGVLVLSYVTALGGGIIRDLLIGARPPAALIVIAAATATWLLHHQVERVPPMLLSALDAGGLALFAVAGAQKSIDYGMYRLNSVFLGAIGGVGGGTMRDVLLNQVPHILYADVYATAALAGAAVVVGGHVAGVRSRYTALAGVIVCFGLRMLAVRYNWQLPKTF